MTGKKEENSLGSHSVGRGSPERIFCRIEKIWPKFVDLSEISVWGPLIDILKVLDEIQRF